MTTLILWDVDHTLIDGGQVSRHAYAAAFRAATGRELTEPWQFDGRTELAAASEVLRAHGLPAEGEPLHAFLELIDAELHARADALAAAGRALPGAVAALTALQDVPGLHQSVLTGNLRRVALLKLSVFGLDGHLDLAIGAYGEDAYERVDLPPFALDRASRVHGSTFTGADTVIVGDTLRDIAAARAVGARAVAVATGPYPADRLAAAGADVTLPDLTDTAAVVEALTGGRPPVRT
ncbi:HAD family hydrolase [Streptacidiphilus monticola]|jgi:phosphoglycolate phosphatase-like HAD superfamily hydrolase|uniref:HAD family hydrolase n=1 Tax=Streptacidiphilus monticola TaxID=2161674 RepID=A0ABW1FUV0_9ACTN